MFHRTVSTIFAVCILFTAESSGQGSRGSLDRNQRHVSQLLDNLESKADKLSGGTIAKLAPELSKLLDRRQPTIDWRVLRLLSTTNLDGIDNAGDLVESVSRLLDSPQQATRSLAVDVICSIGMPAVSEMQRQLKSESPRVRACSATILVRLERLSPQETIALSRDRDPRVRAVAVPLLGESDEGVEILIEMLTDTETAVAYRAAERLGRPPASASREQIARALEKSLARPIVSLAATHSLARLGTDARSSIPKLLSTNNVGPKVPLSLDGMLYGFGDSVDMALARIGKPRDEDIEHIVQILDIDDSDVRIRTCRVLSGVGTKASQASGALKRIVKHDMTRYKKLEDQESDDDGENRHFITSAGAALKAFWFTAQDIDAFCELAEQFDQPWMLDLGRKFWMDVDSQKTELVSALLESDIPAVVEAGLRAFVDSDPALRPLEPRLRAMLRESPDPKSKSIDRKWITSAWLNSLTPNHLESERRAIAELTNGTISLKAFAQHATRLGFQSDDSLKALLSGAKTLDKFDAARCGKAYLQLSGDRISAVRDVTNLPRLGRSWLIQVVAELGWNNPEFIPGAINAMRSTRSWERIFGVRILANVGDKASGTLPEITERFNKEMDIHQTKISDLASECAVAIYKISGDSTHLDRAIRQIARMESDGTMNELFGSSRYLRLLESVVEPGSKYTDLIMRELNQHHPSVVENLDDSTDTVKSWMKLALRTKDPNARNVVVEFSDSKDALISNAARECLRSDQ